jgi:hypothetical protein
MNIATKTITTTTTKQQPFTIVFGPIYSWVVSSFSVCMLSCSIATICFFAGVALTSATAFCCSFSWPLMEFVQLVLSQNFVHFFLKNEGPNRLQPQSLTRPRVKLLVLSHPPGASIVFPCPSFLLLWALLFVIFLPLPPQTKGPIMVPTLMLYALLHETFQLCPAISRRGVMLLQGTVGSSLCCIPLAWPQPMSSTQNQVLHRPDAFSYRRSELLVKNSATLSWLQDCAS